MNKLFRLITVWRCSDLWVFRFNIKISWQFVRDELLWLVQRDATSVAKWIVLLLARVCFNQIVCVIEVIDDSFKLDFLLIWLRCCHYQNRLFIWTLGLVSVNIFERVRFKLLSGCSRLVARVALVMCFLYLVIFRLNFYTWMFWVCELTSRRKVMTGCYVTTIIAFRILACFCY